MSSKRIAGAFWLSVLICILMIVYAPLIGITLRPLDKMGFLAIALGFIAGCIGATPFVMIEVVEELLT